MTIQFRKYEIKCSNCEHTMIIEREVMVIYKVDSDVPFISPVDKKVVICEMCGEVIT